MVFFFFLLYLSPDPKYTVNSATCGREAFKRKRRKKTNILLCLIDGWPLSNRRSPVLARQHARGTPIPDKPDPFHQPPAGKWREFSENSTVGAALCLPASPLSSPLPPHSPLASSSSSPPSLQHSRGRRAAPRSPSAARRLPLFTSRRGLNIDTDSPPANRRRRRRPAPTPIYQWEEAGRAKGAGRRAGGGRWGVSLIREVRWETRNVRRARAAGRAAGLRCGGAAHRSAAPPAAAGLALFSDLYAAPPPPPRSCPVFIYFFKAY